MTKTKGVTFAQKRERLLGAMRKNNEFYIFKEIETLGKKSGIVPQAIKEVLQSIIDDDLVLQDKIGQQNIYWSLQANTSHNLNMKLDILSSKNISLQKEIELEQEKLDTLKLEKEESKEKIEEYSVDRLQMSENKLRTINEEISMLNENSPERIGKLYDDSKIAHEAVQRWTDNIISVRQWIKNRSGLSEKAINEQFGIPREIDDLSDTDVEVFSQASCKSDKSDNSP